MTQRQWQEKWVGHLAGVYCRYHYGLGGRMNERHLMVLLEYAVTQMCHEAQALTPLPPPPPPPMLPANGQPVLRSEPTART
jgi:hypothetical protein